jgi:ABC-type nitrate/sulfonate/bicarbonate transport system substrate-binding protein
MNRTWKGRIVPLVVALVLTLVSGAQGADELLIGIGRDIPLNTHISVALAKGYLKAEGLPSVRLKSFASGSVMTEAMAANEVQVGFAAIAAPVALRNNGVPIVILAQVADNGANNAVLVRSDARVEKPEDLYRLRLALLAGSSATVFLSEIARLHKLDRARLQTVNLPPADAVSAYRGGQVDGVVVWEPFLSRAEAARPSVRLHTYHESFFPSAPGKFAVGQSAMVLVAREEIVRSHPETVSGLLRALSRAHDYVVDRKNADEVLKVASDDIKQDPAGNRRGFDNTIFKLTIDDSLVKALQKDTTFLRETGKTRLAVDPLTWLYSEPLRRVRPAAVTVEGRFKP